MKYKTFKIGEFTEVFDCINMITVYVSESHSKAVPFGHQLNTGKTNVNSLK